jgi:hypothetical protein
MTDEVDEWEKKQAEPLGLFDLANKWAEALKVIGAGNGAGLIAAGAALSAHSANASMLVWIKVGGAIFFVGVLTFALAFALVQLSIFSHDEMLHALRKQERDLVKKQKTTSASAMIGANRLGAVSALCFFIGLCVGLAAFLNYQGAPATIRDDGKHAWADQFYLVQSGQHPSSSCLPV